MRVPHAVTGLATACISALGAVLCLFMLLASVTPAELVLPAGPPGLWLHLALDPLSALFLLVVFACGAAIAAISAGRPGPSAAIALCLAGLSTVVLAADAVTLLPGLGITALALWQLDPRQRPWPMLTTALLLLLALCLLTPAGSPPDFAGIRAAAAAPVTTSVAMALAVCGCLAVLLGAGLQPAVPDDGARQALTAGGTAPCMIYLMIRLILDLPGQGSQAWWGFALLLAGGWSAVVFAWQAARHPDLDASIGCLARQQMGVGVAALGLTLVARTADLPDAASFGLAAALLLSTSGAMAGTLACLAAGALAKGAASPRLARLGGLIHTMPAASAALAAALLGLSALPAGLGFAGLWLLFQSILTAPRTGGLVSQVPVGLIAGAVALSAALATVAAVRLIGIAVLGRPRSVRGSAAYDIAPAPRAILIGLGSLSLLAGILPGPALMALIDPAIRSVIGTGLGSHAGWLTLSASAGAPGYAPLPLCALLALIGGPLVLLTRGSRAQARLVAVWDGGTAPSATLPFGDPATQPVGDGFRPELPAIALRLPRPPAVPILRLPMLTARNRATVGLWAILFAAAAALLALALLDPAARS